MMTRGEKYKKKYHVIYAPNCLLKSGVKIWARMVSELVDSRELIWRLFVRNWLSRYKQAALGFAWALIMPFIAIGTFMILNRSGIINIDKTDIPYPLFALIGLSIWQLFATGLNSGCTSLVSAGSMITKINFPLEVLIFASIAQAMFEFLIKFVLIVCFFFIFKFTPHWMIIFFPLALIPIVLLTIGLSFLLSLMNGILRDTANIVPLFVTFFMFLTPVLYPISPTKGYLFKCNILAPLINGPRDLISYGTIKDPEGFVVASVLSVLCFLISWRIFYLVKTKIPERL